MTTRRTTSAFRSFFRQASGRARSAFPEVSAETSPKEAPHLAVAIRHASRPVRLFATYGKSKQLEMVDQEGAGPGIIQPKTDRQRPGDLRIGDLPAGQKRRRDEHVRRRTMPS